MTPDRQHGVVAYTPLYKARAILQMRRSETVDTRGSALKQHLSRATYGILFRQVATPNFELLRFAKLALEGGLVPLVLEFHQDKFVVQNPAKHALIKLRFHSGFGRNGGEKVRCVTVGNIDGANGSVLQEIHTRWGQNLIAFHHALLQSHPPVATIERIDGSQWFDSLGGGAPSYYPALFELFVRDAVLFESFPLSGCDGAFTANVMLPAMKAVEAQYGRPPLVCRLDPEEAEGDPYWLHYPGELAPYAVGRTADKA